MPGPCDACDHNNPPLGGQSAQIHLQSPFPPGGFGDNRLYNALFGPVALTTGKRIRAVIAWDSCPAGPLSPPAAPALVASDIDLFLVKDGRVVDGSQSIMDSTEGFDVTIPDTLGAGNYSVWWAAPPGNGCGGVGFEPFAWAVWWWF